MPPPRQTPATAFPPWSRTDNRPQRTPTVICPLHLFDPQSHYNLTSPSTSALKSFWKRLTETFQLLYPIYCFRSSYQPLYTLRSWTSPLLACLLQMVGHSSSSTRSLTVTPLSELLSVLLLSQTHHYWYTAGSFCGCLPIPWTQTRWDISSTPASTIFTNTSQCTKWDLSPLNPSAVNLSTYWA